MTVSIWTALIVGLALVALGVSIGIVIAGWLCRYEEPPRVTRDHDNIRLFASRRRDA